MLKIRLKRFGKKHRPFYRIVVMPARSKRQGKTVDEIGFIDPIKKTRTIDKKKAEYWLGVGAKPTYSVERYLVSEKILTAKDNPAKKFSKEPGEKSKQRQEEAKEKEQSKKEEAKEEKKVEEKQEEKKETEAKPEEKKEEKKTEESKENK